MFEQTTENTINIKIHQYLRDVLKIIPSDCIAFKKLPGIGATSGEIEYKKRNSIILEPNVPVIQVKCKRYNTGRHIQILGVYEGKTEEQIIDYLQSSVEPKKILVTPESFRRVKQAIEDIEGYDLYNDFFLLFDECERTIQDVSYRADITLPMIDFFKFKQKAFISATPIIPSDPRFKTEGFKALYIEPDFDYKEQLQLISTNNILLSFQASITNNPREKYFIFFNSTDGIANLITTLDIKNDSAVFCAKESKQKLRANGYTHVYTKMEPFKKYNFFTSRFFSAVDIEYKDYLCNPTIIMLTDLVFAQHSIIDPFSEAIQITGRFRKPEDEKIIINKEVIHISNIDPIISSMPKDETIQYVHDRYIIYEYINNYLQAATSRGTVDALREMLNRSDYNRYINIDGSRNYFMLDNIIHREKVNGYYNDIENLKKAYDLSKYFDFSIVSEQYNFTDRDRKKAGIPSPLKSIFEIIVPVLHEIHRPEYNPYLRMSQIDMLTREFPKAVSAYNALGYHKIVELRFNYHKIKLAIAQKNEKESRFGLLDMIEKRFRINEELSSSQIIRRLSEILRQLHIKHLKPNVQLLKQYCRISGRISLGRDKRGKEIKGYRILEVYNRLRS